MAEWLRPGLWEGGTDEYVAWDQTWLNSDLQKTHSGGLVLKLRPLVTVASVSKTVLGQKGRVVKAPSLHCRERTNYTPDKRGIEILSLKEVHRLGGW